jgi:hypothetical protein
VKRFRGLVGRPKYALKGLFTRDSGIERGPPGNLILESGSAKEDQHNGHPAKAAYPPTTARKRAYGQYPSERHLKPPAKSNSSQGEINAENVPSDSYSSRLRGLLRHKNFKTNLLINATR